MPGYHNIAKHTIKTAILGLEDAIEQIDRLEAENAALRQFIAKNDNGKMAKLMKMLKSQKFRNDNLDFLDLIKDL